MPALFFALVLAFAARGFGADADWIGHTRDEVIATLGKPLSALQRDNTEVLIFPNNVRVDIRANNVVAFRSGSGAVIVASDGTRYAPSDRGKVSKVDAAASTTEAGAPAVPPPPGATPLNAAAAEEKGDQTAAKEMAEADAATDALVAPARATTLSQDEQLLKMTENYENHGKLADQAKPQPVWVGVVKFCIAGLLRFGFALLVLRIAISWIDLPCYVPDVGKVAFLYVIIREGVDGLGGLGDNWEFIRLFMIPDVVGFISLAILLYAFKIVFTGITALKIVFMTQTVTYFLMLGVGVALTFGFAAFR